MLSPTIGVYNTWKIPMLKHNSHAQSEMSVLGAWKLLACWLTESQPRVPSTVSLRDRQAYLFECLFCHSLLPPQRSGSHARASAFDMFLDTGPWWPQSAIGANCTRQEKHEALSKYSVEFSHEISPKICLFAYFLMIHIWNFCWMDQISLHSSITVLIRYCLSKSISM